MSLFHQKIDKNKFKISSDLHINHSNICLGTSKWKDTSSCRPYKTLDEMKNAIITSINNNVYEDDIFIIVGDILFGDKSQLKSILNEIKCKNIHYIYGNHCDWLRNNREAQSLFQSCQEYLEVFIGKKLISIFHYPIYVWRDCHHNSWMLHGHQHTDNSQIRNGKTMDIGWDYLYRPLSYYDIESFMNDKTYTLVDQNIN